MDDRQMVCLMAATLWSKCKHTQHDKGFVSMIECVEDAILIRKIAKRKWVDDDSHDENSVPRVNRHDAVEL